MQKIYKTIGKKLNQPLEYENVLTSSQIIQYIQGIKYELQNRLDSTGVSRDLEMRIIAYPLFPRENLFETNQFSDLKKNLENNASRGPIIDSISPAIIFNQLNVEQNGFYSISSREFIGSIIIKKNGFIIFNVHFDKHIENKRGLLQPYYMAAYFLGFLDLLFFFFKAIEYDREVQLEFNVLNIHEWSYSPFPDWLPYDDKQYRNAEFILIKNSFHLNFLEEVENRIKIVQDIFSEMILGYGETNGYIIPDGIKNQYKDYNLPY